MNIRKLSIIFIIVFSLSFNFIIYNSEKVKAEETFAEQLAYAILVDDTTLLDSQYWDTGNNQQAVVLSSFGNLPVPTDGTTFLLMSTGKAGANPVIHEEAGEYYHSERGTWFGDQHPGWYDPMDEATLTLTLKVPYNMYSIRYDIQFFSTEYPDYQYSDYNDKVTVTVNSPSQGETSCILDVDEHGGDFVLDAHDIAGTGFDIFAKTSYPPHYSTYPSDVDWVNTVPDYPGADAGATALISRQHPVAPNETITVTFNIIDDGDNQFDSAALIDNLMFAGEARANILARKYVEDLNGGETEPGDILEYHVTISNIGTADQHDNDGPEFEDYIPPHTTFYDFPESKPGLTYDSDKNKITWNGDLPAPSSVSIDFQVMINSTTANGTIISNQGNVYWDSTGDRINDALELTDDPKIDDGIDLDNDGETGDDDPTEITVTNAFTPPSEVTEDFSEDTTGANASQYYFSKKWFDTSMSKTKGNFEVAGSYHYSTAKSFKTKIRALSSPQYWNYTLSNIYSDIESWEAWFACGETSEAADLYLDFKNNNGNSIAKIKFEYIQEGSDLPNDYSLTLKYYDLSGKWIPLNYTPSGGYLTNSWYKLKISKEGANQLNYSLYKVGEGLVNTTIDGTIGYPFSNLARVKWYSLKNPVVCPIFFWDEHKLELTTGT